MHMSAIENKSSNYMIYCTQNCVMLNKDTFGSAERILTTSILVYILANYRMTMLSVSS